jgi:hypothetical protein
MPTVSIRVNDADLAEIDARACGRGLSRTALFVNRALGRTPHETDDERFREETGALLADHESRLDWMRFKQMNDRVVRFPVERRLPARLVDMRELVEWSGMSERLGEGQGLA